MAAIARAIGFAHNSSVRLAAATQQLHASADCARESVTHQEETAQRMAVAAAQMTEASEQAAQQSREALAAATSAQSDSEGGRAAVSQSVALLRQLEAAVQDAGAVIQRLNQDSSHIAAMVDVINEVAD